MSDPKSNFSADIKKEALCYIKSLFSSPDQLKKIDLFLSKEINKEKQLELSIQKNIKNNVDNIRSTLKELRISIAEASTLQTSIAEIDNLSKECQKLFPTLEKLVPCSLAGSRLSQTLNLLQQIIDMNSKIEKTNTMLSNMQLLDAHKNLRELESVRDRILSKYFDQINPRISKSVELNLLNKNFEPISRLSLDLFNKISTILTNCIDFFVNEPWHVVTALRIIEREERIDEYWKNINIKNEGYHPSDRPKKLASFLNGFIGTMAKNKAVKIKKETNWEDKFALTNVLELVKKFVLNDILTLQVHGVRCFPPSYQILVRFTQLYHSVVRELIFESLENLGQTPSEIDVVAILLFEKEYMGDQLFGNKKLDKCILSTIRNSEPLIAFNVVQQLEFRYQNIICENLTDKVQRIIGIEKKSLEGGEKPLIYNGKYGSFFGTFYQDFVGIKITYARKLSENMFYEVYKYCVVAFEQLVNHYWSLLVWYEKEQWGTVQNQPSQFGSFFKSDKVEERGIPKWKNYVDHVIGFANNCIVIKECVNLLYCDGFDQKLGNDQPEAVKEESAVRFDNIKAQADEISMKCLDIICDDYIWDVKDFFEELCSQKWKDEAHAFSEGFVNSLFSLSEVLSFLDIRYHPLLYKKIDHYLTFRYLLRFLTFRGKYTIQEASIFGDIIFNESKRLADFFSHKYSVPPEDTFCYAINLCASVFKNPDTDCAAIDLANIAKTYSDFNKDHATALLKRRDDMTKSKIAENIKMIVENRKITPNMKTGIFSDIRLT